LDNVEILDEKKKKGEKVDYGSVVVVELEDGKQHSVTMVGGGEVAVNDDDVKISFDSPIGIAIRGKKAGETAKMRIGNNRQEVKVVSVK
jgi:transcription elongation GreA/GreB family factor